MIDEVYEPAEDSFLMVDVIKKIVPTIELEKNKTVKLLDMGAGSGYIGFEAKKLGCDVIFVDINPKAIARIREQQKRATVFLSDLFFRVPKKIQHIIAFNTPYLPDEPLPEVVDEYTQIIHDVALHGGVSGIEIAIRFLKQVNRYMNDDSMILLLVSDLGDIASLETYLSTHCFSYEVVGEKKLSHEKLFVYKIQRLDNCTHLSKSALEILTSHVPQSYTAVKIFAKGKRGLIFKAKKDGQEVIVKVPLEGRESVAVMEAKHLQSANRLKVGPKFIEGGAKFVTMEFVKGELIGEFLKHATPEEKTIIFDKMLKKLDLMDRIKFNKFELTNPYKHIIIKEGLEPVMVDFERAKYTSRPKNINQFKEYVKKHTDVSDTPEK